VAPEPDPNEYRLFSMKAPGWALWMIWFFVGGFRWLKSVAAVAGPLALVPGPAWDLIPVKIIAEYYKMKYNIASMRVAGKRIRFACPFWHFWCESYRRKFRSIGLMCGCIEKKNKGKHGSGVSMKTIWAWKEEMLMLKWIDAYIVWKDEKRPEKVDLNQERFVVMATIPSPVWVKSEEDRCCAGCIWLGTQQWKLTDYKARMTRLDGVGLKFKDPCKKNLAGKWCEKKWEERMDKMLEIGPCPAVMDLEFSVENMQASGFMPMLESEKKKQAEMVQVKAHVIERGPNDEEEPDKEGPGELETGKKADELGENQPPAETAEKKAAGEVTLAEKIADIKKLHEQGVLDDDEFKSAKAKLLS